KQGSHRFIQRDAVVVEVGAYTSGEPSGLRRHIHPFEATKRDRHSGETAVAGNRRHDRIDPAAEVDPQGFLAGEPGDERKEKKGMKRQTHENGYEKNPEVGEDAHPHPPENGGQDAEHGEGDEMDDPPKDADEPAIDALNRLDQRFEGAAVIVVLTMQTPQDGAQN